MNFKHNNAAFSRRSLLALSSAPLIAGALAFAPQAQAGDYPDKPIRLVVPWAPGGATDVIARVIGQRIGQELGQSVVVDNKPGAGGNIGTALFVREKADGYTLLMGTSSTNAVNPSLYARLPFDAKKDFAPVAFIATVPNILVVPASSSFKTYADVLKAAKEKPGKLTYGSAGNGSSQHLAGSMLMKATGLKMVHVPYKGSGPAASDLIAGHLDLMIDTGSMPHIKSGNLHALGVASQKRIPALPDVPTFAELGVPNFNASAWYGIMAPAGTPEPIITKLNVTINKILKEPAIIKRLHDFGAVVEGGSAPQFKDFALSEIDRYAKIVKESGATVE
ncbi:tripartite tricarboxylate transporter substrate binding protein [Diaphorobacter sp. HDW4A]|uniref:Bug family tripartite tricarboxylate transporter substrate binding protein n=1 Tax=Diaphorobacter sp. HDW4A TaxID=2714924 RepID=UPI00140C07BE|nr:tripartite tricarboxylate transporter substrate binding protein [Diaphorobacter sp. HDW4A]QIL80722.1 tripartite tricarboxylate transporter substrate binding protein [Diaphorobacter sp. HDW4A]